MSDKFTKTMGDYEAKMLEIEAMPISDFEKENLKRFYSGFPQLTKAQYDAMIEKMVKDSNNVNNVNIF